MTERLYTVMLERGVDHAESQCKLGIILAEMVLISGQTERAVEICDSALAGASCYNQEKRLVELRARAQVAQGASHSA